MKNSPGNLRCFVLRPCAALNCALAVLVLVLGTAAPRLAAQSSDFNAGNDTGWTRYELPAYGAPTFSFPADDSGGKAYKIYAPPTGEDLFGMGNARAGSFRADVSYTGRMSIGTDLLTWNADWRQEAGILFYLTTPGLGTSCGYSATYSSGYRNLYISVITGERESTVAELGNKREKDFCQGNFCGRGAVGRGRSVFDPLIDQLFPLNSN